LEENNCVHAQRLYFVISDILQLFKFEEELDVALYVLIGVLKKNVSY